MNNSLLSLVALLISSIFYSCQDQTKIELPLTTEYGFGHFTSGQSGLTIYREAEDNPWAKTYLSVSGAPENWTNVRFGHIETNIYQTVYQNYLNGNISEEWYQELQESWDWQPDTQKLSQEPLKCKIAFAAAKDSSGNVNVVIDANNNRSFSDDSIFTPFSFPEDKQLNRDSVALANTIDISYERLINDKKQSVSVPFFMTYLKKYQMLLGNFPQHLTTSFKGKKLAIRSSNFGNLTYNSPEIAILHDSLEATDKINNDDLIEVEEYLEINGQIFKNKGVNLNRNILTLEKISTPKSDLHSTQIGYQTFPVQGHEFTTQEPISSEQLKGKYVLLDFWAVWCVPCIKEIPNLKALYETTDRKKFEIVSIVGESSAEKLQKLIQQDSINWPQILSNDTNKLTEVFNISGYPTTFLLDTNGTIIEKNIRGDKLEEKVLNLLKG